MAVPTAGLIQHRCQRSYAEGIAAGELDRRLGKVVRNSSQSRRSASLLVPGNMTRLPYHGTVLSSFGARRAVLPVQRSPGRLVRQTEPRAMIQRELWQNGPAKKKKKKIVQGHNFSAGTENFDKTRTGTGWRQGSVSKSSKVTLPCLACDHGPPWRVYCNVEGPFRAAREA